VNSYFLEPMVWSAGIKLHEGHLYLPRYDLHKQVPSSSAKSRLAPCTIIEIQGRSSRKSSQRQINN